MNNQYIGQAKPRKNDRRLITGQGSYIADVEEPGTLHAAFLRSPHAHARVEDVDYSDALKLEGVEAVFGPQDARDLPELPHVFKHPALHAVTEKPLGPMVHFAGEAVAMVLGDSRYTAEDALEAIDVKYEPLPAVGRVQDAMEDDAPVVHEDMDSNLAAELNQSYGDAESALEEADVRVSHRFNIARAACLPIENRGLMAHWNDDGVEDMLEVTSATQGQHEVRELLSETLDLPEQSIRVRAPDVGGAFGAKAPFYPEDLLVSWATIRTGRPVKWVEDRMEHMKCSIHEREQYHEAELGITSEGKIVAVTDRFVAGTGAYIMWGIIVPILTSTMIPGAYKVPNYNCDVRVFYTNATPHAPMRGAGRPAGNMVTNRLLDRAARELDMDPLELRKRNLIQPDEFPYQTGLPSRSGGYQTYDSGNYPELVKKMRSNGDYEGWRNKQQQDEDSGKRIGIGTAVAIENTGFGNFEGATLRAELSGEVTVSSGAATQGQGHETTLAQVAAEELNMDPDRINVREGDTDEIAFGTGTFASRIATVAGSAVHKAAASLKEKALAFAGEILEEDPSDLVLSDGVIRHRSDGEVRIDLSEVAHEARGVFPGSTYEFSSTPGLEVTEYFTPKAAAISSMADMAVVEVDVETGEVSLLDYTSVHDCGTILNELIVDGQVIGGIGFGIGNSLYEEIVYDEQGQLLSGSLMDYLIPTASEVPDINLDHIETPSPHNPLGVKGVGESGVIPVPTAIQSAVEDALSEWDVPVEDIPIKPGPLRERIHEAGVSPGKEPGS